MKIMTTITADFGNSKACVWNEGTKTIVEIRNNRDVLKFSLENMDNTYIVESTFSNKKQRQVVGRKDVGYYMRNVVSDAKYFNSCWDEFPNFFQQVVKPAVRLAEM